MINQYCEECGISASISYNQDLKDHHQAKIDEKLDEIAKVKTTIRSDGHCLPRAIFRGYKLNGLLEQYIMYKNLFKLTTKETNDNWGKYCFFTDLALCSAVNDLNAYLNDKQYTLPSLALDLILYAMSTVTLFTINVYYYTQNELKKHKFGPSNIYPVNYIDLVHWNGHYDLVTGKNSDLKEPPKARRSSSEVITIWDSPCKIELDVSKVKTESNAD